METHQASQTKETALQRSEIVRFFRWLFSWRTSRRVLLGLAVLATLMAVFYTVENWRGQRAWTRLKNSLEARGERLDMASLIPPPVPDEQNMAMAPIFGPLVKRMTFVGRGYRETNIFGQFDFPLSPSPAPKGLKEPPAGNWKLSEPIEWQLWEQYYHALSTNQLQSGSPAFPMPTSARSSAEAVLMALGIYNGPLEALREAAQRPFSRFPLQYENHINMLLPHLYAFKKAAQFLRVRIAAELQLGRAEEALGDLNLGLRLCDALKDEPILISQLVRIAMLDILLQPIWEGLAEHRWTAGQLERLQARLESIDLIAGHLRSMRGERASFNVAVDEHARLRQKSSLFMAMHSQPGEVSELPPILLAASTWLLPHGWFEQNKAVHASLLQTYYIDPVLQEQASGHFKGKVNEAEELSKEFQHWTPYNHLARLLLPSLGKARNKAVRCQTWVNLAATACALERYRLAKNGYPESLPALVPEFSHKVPTDLLSGQPLKYQRTNASHFVLYSVGENEVDDGGQVASKGKPAVPDYEQGDWVWRYPSRSVDRD